jgi:hypothetical protein
MLLLTTMVAACGGGDDDEEPTQTPPTPTAGTVPASPVASPQALPGASPVASPVATPGSPRPSATFAPGLALLVSDGICQAQVPLGWVDTGFGRGSAGRGARFVLFGGAIRDDAAWGRAVDLVLDQSPNGEVTGGSDFVLVTFPDGTGFDYRARFGDVYCDFTLTSQSPVPPSSQRDWEKIMGSVGPVSE